MRKRSKACPLLVGMGMGLIMCLSGGCARYGKKVDVPCAVDAASKCFHEMEKCVIDDSEEKDHVAIQKDGQ